MKQDVLSNHNFMNWLHTLLLLLGMLLIVALLGYLLAGFSGIVWAVLLSGLFLIFGQQVSPQLVLRMYKARPLSAQDAPALYQIVQELGQRAQLAQTPQLYYIPSEILNAFAVGTRQNAAIGVTDGILRALNLRELTGVLAHEMSHIRNNDMRAMAFADIISRVAGFFSSFGKLLIFFNLPLIFMGRSPISWWAVLLLVFAPLLTGLLQLALSRTREFDADLDAVALTHDPVGLASALQKLERYQTNLWQQVLLPGYRVPAPSIFRTHPHTEDRIARLLQLTPDGPGQITQRPETPLPMPGRVVVVPRRPVWNGIMGLWY